MRKNRYAFIVRQTYAQETKNGRFKFKTSKTNKNLKKKAKKEKNPGTAG